MARTTPVNSGYAIINGSATGSNKAYVDVWLEWKQLSKDTTNNISTVQVLLYAACTKSSSTAWSVAENFGYVGYDGGNKQYRSTTYDFSDYAVNCFGDHTFTIAHDSDGTKSVTLEGAWSTSHSTYISGGSVSGKVTLETIPRASSITSAGDVTLGNACSVTWTPCSAAFRYKLIFSCGGSNVLTTDLIHPNKTSSYTYTGSTLSVAAFAPYITGSKTGTVTVSLETYSDSSGSTKIGSDSESFTATVPEADETRPTFDMALSFVNDFNGIILQNRTRVQAAFSGGNGKLGATVESYSLTVEGKSYGSPYLSNSVTDTGQITVKGTATDSRGISGSVEQVLTVVPYFLPRLPNIAVFRCTSAGTAADDGEFLRICAQVEFASVEEQNSCALYYRYKTEGETAYGEDIPLFPSLTSGVAVMTEPLLEGTFLKENAYSVQLVAVDTVGSQVVCSVNIPSERIYKHKRAGGKGLGLGGYCEQDDLLDVYWNGRVRKGFVLGDGVGSVYISVTEDDPSEIFGGGWEEIEENVPSAVKMWQRTE